MTLGQRIQKRRQELGLGRTELSRRAGVSHATINLIETGKTEQLTSSSLMKIAAALQCTVEWLVGQPGPAVRVIQAHAGSTHQSTDGALILVGPLQQETEVGQALPPIAIPAEWIEESGVHPSNARNVTATVTALEGRIAPGDSVLIDIGDAELVDGRAYLISFMGSQVIRRVFLRPDGLVLKAPDSSGIDLPLPHRQTSQVRVIGRLFRVISKSGL